MAAKEGGGPAVSRRIFGGVLEYDGAGHYPGVELLNLIFCTAGDELLPVADKVQIKRRTHDFARKLVWSKDLIESHKATDLVLNDSQSGDALRSLLGCLQLPIPSSVKQPTWERAHFFPYTMSLIHWDARKKGNKNSSNKNEVNIERRYLRGGGALAFKVLRMDPDLDRLKRTRLGFEELYGTTQASALEKIASVLVDSGKIDNEFMEDAIEFQSELFGDEIENMYRQGIDHILSHTNLATVVRIRSVIRWTALWLVLTQHTRAARILSDKPSYLIVDCASANKQLRRESQRCLKEKQTLILQAVDKIVEDTGFTVKQQRRNSMRSFFWASAATVGLLNAWRGRRHFTLGVETIETLVMASTAQGKEVSFESFLSDHLFQEYGMVVGRSAAESAGLLSTIDGSVFEDNENHLARQMAASGLLTEYSDASRMVGIGEVL